jgi:hypothetical protein
MIYINLAWHASDGKLTVEEVNGATKEKLEQDMTPGGYTVLYLASEKYCSQWYGLDNVRLVHAYFVYLMVSEYHTGTYDVQPKGEVVDIPDWIGHDCGQWFIIS